MSEEKKKSSFLKDFRDFAIKGNMIDMAVGVIIGTAFGAIVNSIVNDLIMPLFNALFSNIPLSSWAWTIKEGVDGGDPILFKYGNFLQALVNFLIIALCVFLFTRLIAKIKDMAAKKAKEEAEEAAEEAAAAEPEPTEEVKLLTEIRDLLSKKD